MDQPEQLPPVEAYALRVGSTDIGYVVSLGSSAKDPWRAWSEHWFRNGDTDYQTVFETKDDFEIDFYAKPGPEFDQLVQELSSEWDKRFEMYAVAELKPANWSSKAPTLEGNIFYFDAGGPEPDRPRVAFYVDANDGTKLNGIVWVSDSNTVSTYPAQKIVLRYKDNSLPKAAFYYVASPKKG